MKTYSYTESRKRYADVLNEVIDDREPTVITRAGHESVVMLALDDYNALRETDYLLRSPANAAHLARSLEQLRNGGGEAHELIEE